MSDEAGGWLWLLIDVAFVAELAAALFYGIAMWRRRRRDPRVEQIREEATRDLYKRSGNE
jgi:hypothetical protein